MAYRVCMDEGAGGLDIVLTSLEVDDCTVFRTFGEAKRAARDFLACLSKDIKNAKSYVSKLRKVEVDNA